MSARKSAFGFEGPECYEPGLTPVEYIAAQVLPALVSRSDGTAEMRIAVQKSLAYADELLRQAAS